MTDESSMRMAARYDQKVEPERALLVGIDRGRDQTWPLDESLSELARLTDTAGAVVVETMVQRLDSINPRTFIGSGKAEEVASRARSLDIAVVIFDDELSPSQQSNLEKICASCKVIDRTALILDIFALHAQSREGRLQVRLAQNQYLLPRLRGMWAHLASNRMGGGVGSRFGEGESQLEVDRRMVRKRITSIQRELKQLERTRGLQRKSREESGVYRVSLAGYTNAGKSSLINALTGSDVLVHDQLFATLDSTTRRLELSEGREVTLTDTVGFIQKLPHSLVEAFKSTLDEISGSNLILQVIDASSVMRDEQAQAVRDVLEEIGASGIPTIPVFNKIDLLDEGEREVIRRHVPDAVLISTVSREGLDGLIGTIERYAAMASMPMDVLIPFSEGGLVQIAHERCTVRGEGYCDEGTMMSLLVPSAYVSRFAPYEATSDRDGWNLQSAE